MLEKTLESPLDGKEIKTVNPKGNQPWIFMGRTDAEVEASKIGHLMQKADLLGKTQQHCSKASSVVLNFLYGPTLTCKHDYWKNDSFD